MIANGHKIGYVRVSEHEQNLDLQLDAMHEAGCSTVYQEKVSGKHTGKARPEQEAALKALRRGDTLVVWKLDRLGGSLADLVRITSVLRERGVELESVTQQIDTHTPHGKMFMGVLAVLAEYERDLLVERTKAGLKAARARGRRGGKPPSLTHKQVRQIEVLLRDPDVTVTDVAKQYGVSRGTIYNHLRKKAREGGQEAT